MVQLQGPVEVTQFIEDLNNKYVLVHKAFEDNFWSTKMGLAGNSTEDLAQTKTQYDEFLSDAKNLAAVREKLQVPQVTPEQAAVLKVMERTFKAYITEDEEARQLLARLNTLEAELGSLRGKMALGYVDPATGTLTPASSVSLRNKMRTDPDEAVRKACYKGLYSIGAAVAEPFLEIVKLRNRFARIQGAIDFYDYKVSAAEGFGKGVLFEKLDDLERQTRPIMESARAALAADKGASALEPWNTGYVLSGDVEKQMDPYFPFEEAVDVWGRTFAAMGIGYSGSTMRLDLLDRVGKYSNGFCHWPQPAYRKADGTWIPAQANFTSLAIPDQVGSGKEGLVTLLHEGGHAAHFANIDQATPFMSQERAPTSVAYAENQSMFLDSLIGDSAWVGRYALNRQGEVLPWEILKANYEAKHPYTVFGLRAMLSVSYFEKELYELPEESLTVATLLELADRVENHIQGGLSGRPILSVPHILSDESACYYHGYTLAEMSVYQTRAHFLQKYGRIVDEPRVGADLTEVYWRPGNGAMFLDLVEKLTGKPLNASDWVKVLQKSTAEKLEEERVDYDAAVKAGAKIAPGQEVDLKMRVLLADGDLVIADSDISGFQGACTIYKKWVAEKYPAKA